MPSPDKIDHYRRQAEDINCRLRESEIFHWLGDKGGLDLKLYEARAFTPIDLSTKKAMFMEKLKFRMPATQQETFHKTDSPADGCSEAFQRWQRRQAGASSQRTSS
jgi:hypothetical protein